MALSIQQYPASCSLAQSPIAFAVSESSGVINSASFQYNADVFYWTGTPNQSGSAKYTLVKYPNTADSGIFDFSRIINSTLVDLRQENPSNVVYFAGEFYFSYASSSISTGTTTIVTGSRVKSGTYKALDGYAVFQEPINQQIVSKSEFWPLMTSGPVTQSIFEENKGTFGVYTGAGCNLNVSHLLYSSSLTSSYLQVSSSISSSQQIQQAPAFPSEPGFPITYADSYKICPVSASVSGSVVETITNVSASFYPFAFVAETDSFTIDDEKEILNNANSICWYTASLDTLYVVSVNADPIFSLSGGDPVECARVKSVNCSTGEIELGTNWLIAADAGGYTGSLVFANSCSSIDNIFMSSSFSTVGTTVYTEVGQCIQFEEACLQKYPNIRIKWKNRFGQFDYFNFYMVNRQSFQTTNRSYQPQLGSWEGSTLGYNNYDSGKLNYIVDSQQSLTVNTNWISEDYNELLKQMLVSEEIYWIYDEANNDLRPITIATETVTFKTGVVDKTIQYSFDFNWGQGYKLIL